MVIGDLHGRDLWKGFADINYLLQMDIGNVEFDIVDMDYDYYVFLGDYCDAFDKSNQQIIDNLNDLIRFKDLYPRNVILLWGNHELHYVLDTPWTPNGKHVCSGYRPEMHYQLYEILNKNFRKFQMAFQVENYLFTHAGVHKGWYNDKFVKQYAELEEKMAKFELEYPNETLADKLNFAFEHRMECMFDVGHRRGGHAKVGGPLWLDKALANKPLEGYHQYVGHTAIRDVQTIRKGDDTTITFLDINHHQKAFYVVNIK